MTKAEMEVVIGKHARNVHGNPHRFRVVAVAVEPRGSRVRCLLSIDVCPERPGAGLWAPVQVLSPIRTTREQLLCLVNDAVDEFLHEHGFHASAPVDARPEERDYRTPDTRELAPTATAGLRT